VQAAAPPAAEEAPCAADGGVGRDAAAEEPLCAPDGPVAGGWDRPDEGGAVIGEPDGEGGIEEAGFEVVGERRVVEVLAGAEELGVGASPFRHAGIPLPELGGCMLGV